MMNNEKKFRELKQYLNEDKKKEFRKKFLDMHFHDQGEFFLSLNKDERQKFYQFITPDETGDMFDTIEDDHPQMAEFLEEMDVQYAADMLNSMYDDNAADVLEHLDKEDSEKYLNKMPRQDANNLRGLLHYDTETAGGLMTTDFVSFNYNLTVAEALVELKKVSEDVETINNIYIVDDEGYLVGVMSLREIIRAPSAGILKNEMNKDVISVYVEDDQNKVAQVFKSYDFLLMPVIDHSKKLVGIITVDDVLDIIDDEAQSDYSGLAGVNVEESISDNPVQSATKRLPWLIVLLFFGTITATLISNYEYMLREASVLAVFISLITGTAGNAGTQSLAVAVRRLAVDSDGRSKLVSIILRELLTGVITGFVTGLAIFVIVGFWQHNFILGFVVGLSMMIAIIVANLAGALIPVAMSKMGFDPAVASGPFISTLSDLTSVIIYFNIAQVFMRFFMN